MAIFMNKIIRVSCCLLLLFMADTCLPSFTPKELVRKEIKQGEVSLKWIDLIGILDQDFPDYITIQTGKQIDTICQSHNIADIRIEKDSVVIQFYGSPKKYNDLISIPDNVLGHIIVIDTTVTN